MAKAVVFVATCPNCKREQLQDGFTLEDLARLLEGGFPIEAHCAFCETFSPISLQTRVELGAVVAASVKDGAG